MKRILMSWLKKCSNASYDFVLDKVKNQNLTADKLNGIYTWKKPH